MAIREVMLNAVMGRYDWHLHRVPRAALLVALSALTSRSPQDSCTAHRRRAQRPHGGPPAVIVTSGFGATVFAHAAGLPSRNSTEEGSRPDVERRLVPEEGIEPTRGVNPTGF